MKFQTVKYEILEEVVNNRSVYWVLRKVYYFNCHTYTQLIGMDEHNEVPFIDKKDAELKLQELCQD